MQNNFPLALTLGSRLIVLAETNDYSLKISEANTQHEKFLCTHFGKMLATEKSSLLRNGVEQPCLRLVMLLIPPDCSSLGEALENALQTVHSLHVNLGISAIVQWHSSMFGMRFLKQRGTSDGMEMTGPLENVGNLA